MNESRVESREHRSEQNRQKTNIITGTTGARPIGSKNRSQVARSNFNSDRSLFIRHGQRSINYYPDKRHATWCPLGKSVAAATRAADETRN